MRFVFVSNYLNHHQIPFCRAMYRLMGGSFAFLQTEPVEEERVRMGWSSRVEEPYLRLYYEEPETCRELILQAQVVLFGGTDDESYIQERLQGGKPVIRYSERLYKTGQWKAISPRGLRKKYQDHTKYRNAQVYLLCSGAYVPSDFHIVRAYPGKMFCWGYFPEAKHYELDGLFAGKGYPTDTGEKIPYLLWSGRMVDWKHPELALQTAKYLKEKGIRFHLDMIGGGDLEAQLKEMAKEFGLNDMVSFLGFLTPAEVREHMEKAEVYLLTSDRQEGWGAVANEAMNSGCALVADHMIGAAPYLIRHGVNGCIYRDGDSGMLFRTVEELIKDPVRRNALGHRAYETITTVWNADFAARQLCTLLGRLLGKAWEDAYSDGAVDTISGVGIPDGKDSGGAAPQGFFPCAPAPVISERKMFRYLTQKT